MRWTKGNANVVGCVALAALIGVAVTGCDPIEDEMRDAPADPFEVVFDPDTGQIPLPNAAALDEQGVLPPELVACEDLADGHLEDYLTSLQGWPDSAPISLTVSEMPDMESIGDDDIQLWRRDGDDWTRIEALTLTYRDQDIDACTGETTPAHIIDITPTDDVIELGGEYFAFATQNIESTVSGTTPLMASEPLHIAMHGEELVDEEGRSTSGFLSDEEAQALAGLRQTILPAIEVIEEDTSFELDEVAAIWSWPTWDDNFVMFDGDAGIIPTPNTAALDEDGTFPEAGTCEAGEQTAQGYFDDYLAGLSGWPMETPITLTLSSAPDVESLDDDEIQLWQRVSDEEWERVEDYELIYRDFNIDPCGEEYQRHVVELVPEPGVIGHAQEYFAFATRDGAGEASLRAEIPLYLAMQPVELVDENGNSALDMLSDEDAQALQQLRHTLQPALDVIDAETDLSPDDLAAVWQWHTWDDTFVVFEPELEDVPFPNQAVVGEEGTVDLPLPGEDDPTRAMIEALNQRSGFSPNAPGWISLWGGIDESTLDHEAMVMGAEEGVDTDLMGEDDYHLSFEEDWGRITFEAARPLTFGQQYVAAVTTDLIGVNGRPVQPTPPFVFLRSPHPLVEDGESQVNALDDATAQELEEARDDFELLFTVAPMVLGKQRDEIATAWVYSTEEPTSPMEDFRQLVLGVLDGEDELRAHRACDVEGGDCDDDEHLVEVGDVMEHPNDAAVEVAMDNVSHMYTGGEFNSVPVDVVEGGLGDESERVGITVYLPEDDQSDGSCEAPYDVVIAQHGLGQDRHHSGVAMANELAAAPGCMATVAMDFPLHGGRSLVEVGEPDPHPESTPANTGEGFFTADLLSTQANLIQGVMDLTVLAQIVQEEIEVEIEGDNGNGDNGNDDNGNDDNGAVVVGGLDGLFADLDDVDGPLFSDRIGFMGVSAGGFMGVPFAATEPGVESVVLSGVGGRLAWLLEGDEEGPSELGQPILDMLADDTEGPGIEPGDREFFEAMLFIQWLADYVDPVNFASTVGEETEVLLQMVDGDRVIVNRGTEVLAEELSVSLEDTTFEEVTHGFIFTVDESDDDFDAGHCARRQASAWLDSGLLGEGEIPADLTAQACLD